MAKKAVLTRSKCDHSPFCPVKRVCPVQAITQKKGFLKADYPEIDPAKCVGCGKCVSVCPHGAVVMK